MKIYRFKDKYLWGTDTITLLPVGVEPDEVIVITDKEDFEKLKINPSDQDILNKYRTLTAITE